MWHALYLRRFNELRIGIAPLDRLVVGQAVKLTEIATLNQRPGRAHIAHSSKPVCIWLPLLSSPVQNW